MNKGSYKFKGWPFQWHTFPPVRVIVYYTKCCFIAIEGPSFIWPSNTKLMCKLVNRLNFGAHAQKSWSTIGESWSFLQKSIFNLKPRIWLTEYSFRAFVLEEGKFENTSLKQILRLISKCTSNLIHQVFFDGVTSFPMQNMKEIIKLLGKMFLADQNGRNLFGLRLQIYINSEHWTSQFGCSSEDPNPFARQINLKGKKLTTSPVVIRTQIFFL